MPRIARPTITALNCYLTSDAAHLFTDGAIYASGSGKIEAIGSKIIPVPHLNAVFGYSGPYTGGSLMYIAMMESRHKAFDDLAANLAGFAKAKALQTRGLPGWPASFAGVEIVLAGISEESGAPAAYSLKVFRISGVENGKPVSFDEWRVERFTRYQMPDVSMAFQFDRVDPEGCGRKLVQEQRSRKVYPKGQPSSDLSAIYGVGGFLQYTKVTRDSIEMKVLERWPDEVGEMVNPFDR